MASENESGFGIVDLISSAGGAVGKITGSDLLTGGTSLLGSLIGAGAGLIQGAQERKFNARQAALNREFQTSEREAAQEWNLEQWNRENEYNTPEAQMQRMVAAGINPNIAAQAIGGNATSPGQVRTSGQSGSQASAPGSIAGSLMDIVGNSVNTMWQNINQQRDAEGKETDNAWKDRLYGKQMEEADARITEMLSSAAKNDQDRKNAEETGKWIAQRSEAEIKVMNQTLTNLKKEWDQMNAEIKKTEAETGVLEENKKILTEQQKIEAIKASLAEQGIIAGYNQLQSLLIYMQENDVSDLFNTFMEFFNYDEAEAAAQKKKDEKAAKKAAKAEAKAAEKAAEAEAKAKQKEEAALERGAKLDAQIAEIEEQISRLESNNKPVPQYLRLQLRKLKKTKQSGYNGFGQPISFTPYGEGDVNP